MFLVFCDIGESAFCLTTMTETISSVQARDLLKRLPAFSPIAIKLMVLVVDDNVSFKEVAKLFSLDPVLSGQVLRLANSGMYGREFHIQSVLHALAMLGLRNISRIAITAALSQGVPRQTSPWMRVWWRHSIATALLADHAGVRDLDLDFGYTAGLLHAIGQLALFQTAPREYPEILDAAYSSGADVEDLMECEREHFGADHAELSGLILSEWGLPGDLQRAVSEYHVRGVSEPLTKTVHAGCAYAESLGFGQCGCLQTVEDASGKPMDRHLLDVLATEVNLIECSLA